MTTKIIAVSGRKSSGKSSLCNYIQAYLGAEDFNTKYSGKPLGQGEGPAPHVHVKQDTNGSVCFHSSTDAIPFALRDLEFLHLTADHLSKKVKIYNFADALKELCINLLGLQHEQVWGTEEQKNSLTQFSWDKLPTCIQYANKKFEGPMTAREIMQVVGTDVMRTMFYNDIWIDSTIRAIRREEKPLALIADMRFRGEFEAIHKAGGYIIRLERTVFEGDKHSSEVDFDGFDFSSYPRTLIIPADTDITTKNKIAIDWLKTHVF